MCYWWRIYFCSYRGIWIQRLRYKTWSWRNNRDIPNVSEESLRNLDESGIVYVGAEVKPGDILVGKVTKKVASQVRRKIIEIYFRRKSNWRKGLIAEVTIWEYWSCNRCTCFNRHGIEKDERSIAIERIKSLFKRIKKLKKKF